MVSLTFYGGANEIGGNKILLEDKDAKIYLDFGQSFDFGEKYFYEWLEPREANGLEVLFEFDLLPKIPKLYSQKMLRFSDLKYEKPNIDAVFISHSHSDHVNHIQYLDEKIPVYMGHGTKTILDAYSTIYPQFYKLKEHDFRLHGPKQEYTEEFIQKAKKSKPVAMLCEGTRMYLEDKENFTEQQIEDFIEKIIKGSKGIVFSYFSMSNIDRFFSFYNNAIKHNKILVIDPKFCFILQKLKEKIPTIPDPRTDANMRVYYRISKTGTFVKSDYKYKYETEDMRNIVTYKEIKQNQNRYVMHMNFFKLIELVYIQPKNADFIYSSSEHFFEGEDNEQQKEVVMRWMDHFNIKFHKAHCSGHADNKALKYAIDEIKPNILIPIHTQNAKEFEKIHNNVLKIENRQKIEI